MPAQGEAAQAGSLRVHGGIAEEELALAGIDSNDVVDFSSSVNPYGPSPRVVRAVQAARIDRYPDPASSLLRRALATLCDAPPARIVVGNGAADLLWTLARVLVRPGTRVLVVEPTFAEFRAAASLAGATVLEHRASAVDDFVIDMDALDRRARAADVLYLCSPATPTGVRVPVERVASLAARHPGVMVVLDQAFVSLCEAPGDDRVPVPDNVVRVRSLTKDHAIAGLRLGYLVASLPLAARIETSRPPWSTSSVAQAAGLAALEESDFVDTSRVKLLRDRDELASALRRVGLSPVPSTACFFVFPVAGAGELRRRLLTRKVLVRDCASFGLPDFVRVSARPKRDRDRLLAALLEEVARC